MTHTPCADVASLHPGQTCCNESWEAAYARFETPEQELAKFRRRLLSLGADRWPVDSEILELCCGRGTSLLALAGMGFTRLSGIDLSASLLAQYQGPGQVLVGDVRQLPFSDGSRDLIIVQGGLHHLQRLPDDLTQTLIEAQRVLRPGGLFVAIEPWLTPFLRFVHAVCRVRLVRRLVAKLDALATMIEHEQETYDQWLGQPEAILQALDRSFVRVSAAIAWGKLAYVGRKATGETQRPS